MQEISEVDLRAGQRKAVANESFSAEHFERYWTAMKQPHCFVSTQRRCKGWPVREG